MASKAKNNATITSSLRTRIEQISINRETWENSVYVASNEKLYSIIGDCLSLYYELVNGTDIKAKKKGLEDYINIKGYKFKDSTALSGKIIRCVFGDRDRRRLSTYHIALRVAIADKWDVADVAKKISVYGGIQEISMRKKGGLSAADRAAQTKDAVMSLTVATLQCKNLQMNAEHVGENAIAFMTQEANGTYSVHFVMQSTTAQNAALAAYFSANKEKLSKKAEAVKVVEKSKAKTELINNAVAAANDSKLFDKAA